MVGALTRPGGARRGLGILGMLILLFIFVGIGVSFSMLARQTGRSSHWYHDSQLALDLAECALKEACAEMRESNGAGKSSYPPFERLFQLVTTGDRGETITLFSTSAGDRPAALRAFLDGPISEYSPSFDVQVKLVDWSALVDSPVNGFPVVAGERKGILRLTGRGIVQSSTGIRVERTLMVEKGFRVISLIPPLVGRFALYSTSAPETNPNFVPMTLASGNGQASGVRPLEIRAGPAVELVKPSGDLDPATLASGLAPDFLDKSGWVFLGGGQPWDLRVAHGWGEMGESPLLEGYMRGPLPGDFADKLAVAIRDHATVPPGDARPVDGLYYYDHGFCDEYSLVGIPDAIKQEFQGAKALKLPDTDPSHTSALRLFGSPGAWSPTLVLGGVQHAFIRRAVAVTQLRRNGRDEPYRLHLKRLQDYPEGITRKILEKAFVDAAGYESKGPRVMKVSAAEVLNRAVNPSPAGAYGTEGLLKPTGAAAGGATYESRIFTGLGSLPAGAGGVPAATANALASGEVDFKDVYKGNLNQGLANFATLVGRKITFTLTRRGAERLVKNGKLRVPGVAFVKDDAEITIPACTVVEGGILAARGNIKITGDITAAAGGKEPLTLVSLKGDIVIAGASRVQAYLVAASPGKKVKLGTDNLAIEGGVASDTLDLAAIRSGANRTISWSPDFDPADTARVQASMRAFYGGEERVSLSGGDQ